MPAAAAIGASLAPNTKDGFHRRILRVGTLSRHRETNRIYAGGIRAIDLLKAAYVTGCHTGYRLIKQSIFQVDASLCEKLFANDTTAGPYFYGKGKKKFLDEVCGEGE